MPLTKKNHGEHENMFHPFQGERLFLDCLICIRYVPSVLKAKQDFIFSI